MKRKMLVIILFTSLLFAGAFSLTLAAPPAQDEADGQSYVVQANDWLSKLADQFYGDILAYPTIVEATNAKAAEDDTFAVIDNPDLIEIGQKLWIPNVDMAMDNDMTATEAMTMTETMTMTEDMAPTETMTMTEDMAPTETMTMTEDMAPTETMTMTEEMAPTETMTMTEDMAEGMAEEGHEVHWSYEGEGAPEHWAELDPAYEACGAGMEQSPLDLTGASLTDLENITFNYAESAVNILNNGHTIQVNYDEGSSVEINGATYNLLQFHFHAPSEHAVDGSLYPAEMHLVHADADGNLAVVGVFIAEGAENPAFAPVWDHLPSEAMEAMNPGTSVNAADLLPADQVVYRYNGSLTTPPCSEGVLWSVMANPVEMSAEQIAAFTAIFDGTNRPVQPLNDRELQLDNTP